MAMLTPDRPTQTDLSTLKEGSKPVDWMSPHYKSSEITGMIRNAGSVTELLSILSDFTEKIKRPMHSQLEDTLVLETAQNGFRCLLRKFAASAYSSGIYYCTIDTFKENGEMVDRITEHKDSPVKLPKDMLSDQSLGRILRTSGAVADEGLYDTRLLLHIDDICNIYKKFMELEEKAGVYTPRDKMDSF